VRNMALVELTLDGERNKVDEAIVDLRRMQPLGGYCLKFSGGKDSQAIYHLSKMAGVEFRAQYDVTTVDPPELIEFIRENYADVVFNYPETTMWKLIPKKRIPPTRVIRYCCDVFKEKGCPNMNMILTGVRWKESRRRGKRHKVEICQAYKKKTFLHPVISWEESDVWEFLNGIRSKHCCLYDEGWSRIGCVGCPMANSEVRERELNRYPKIRDAYWRAFGRMLEEIKREKAYAFEEFTKWKSPDDVMEWWLHGTEQFYDKHFIDGQQYLFNGDYYEHYELEA